MVIAMENELRSMAERQVWELTRLPPGIRLLPNRWIYERKKGPNPEVIRHEARLTMKGFFQRQLDRKESFAPVSRFESLRVIFSIAAWEKLVLYQLDVKFAVLYGHPDEEIYMEQPTGFADGTEKVCRLGGPISGLR